MSTFLTFCSGVGSVTGANFLLEINSTKVLIDCGLIQGEKVAQAENREDFPYKPSEIDMLFITHAHLDHVGRIPKIVKEGFNGVIYSTPETFVLAQLIIEDALGLLTREAINEGILPLYEEKDMKKAFTLWQTIPYHENRTFPEGFSLYLKDAGHILGSSMFEFTIEGKKIVFTGDLGNSPTPLLRDTESVEGADYVIMESVYGDRNHESKEERREKLQAVIKDAIERKGTLIIPAFSLERTQVILYEINKLVESGEILSVPVFVDSPLAIKVTEIYKNSVALFNDRIKEEIRKGDDIFNFPKLSFTVTTQESSAIDHTKSPKIIIAGSGMSIGGRVIHHEEMYLNDSKNTVLLIGYQTLGSVGRYLLDGAKKVTIHQNEIKVNAKIESILGYSSHKDSDHLVEFAETAGAGVKKIFVAMGEPKASLFLVQKIRDNLGIDAMYPERLKRYELN
ncbi:MAG: MBL fold metallo-hydrolase [Candidatus Taylorbacteria bacterium]|nr:MBL fold metallo-hydrolase [Candidatus Taylorbacteria bacterium]